MATRAFAIIAALTVAGLVIGPVTAVILRAEAFSGFTPADGQALRFTLVQATLSAALSVLFAIPLARALARRQFPGRGVLVALLGAPFILPVIVAVLGLIAVFGQTGLLNRALAPLGLPEMQIYGLHGVLIAHVFFNLPLATRLILQGWLAVPAEQFRLAATLGLGPRAVWSSIEAPMLMRIVPGAFAVIFVICLSSFAVALTLGGGPRATTLELAIYQSMRFDFDLARAAALGLVQLGLALTAGLIALKITSVPVAARGLDRVVPRWDGQGALSKGLDTMWISLAAAFLLTPLAMVALSGLAGIPTLGASVWQAAGHSITVALGSTLLCLLWALPLATRWGEWLGLAGIALSPLVLGIGLFLIVRPFANPFDLALYVTATVNAFVSLPFVLRILRPEAEAIRADYTRLRAALGLSGWAWLRWVFLPRLKRPLGFAAGLTAALSMGDLGVIALFADPDRATLPLKVFQLMGAYRMEQAAGAALLLLILSLGLFWALDRGGRVGSAS
ncbi:thiamine/thiamine pyrophosphate ABC transporter permease ThiP [Marivita sp. S6314]|uniref:thiamine/thiamine pyrophosphate ABC transporter permease ThiP n=1 Tax=Marivita sp. S6314 TaxID=2926406 RepID=UPI001FF45F15|nr:thiamine/thiamine pyrophosphate ABC transporter permease ThiP [Marivita sp. S6314]MCK0150038.1 thiamine/thiamine pyrophosphate ABC transporter permease ThiP [Marivita sp. S6314]